jgi:hypothetical protein
LKPGEKLRGGFELIYQAYGIDRLSMKEKLDLKNPIYGEDINGFIAEYMYVKSKNHGEAIPYRMVIDKRRGYIPELSDFEYLYSVNYGIAGAGASIYLQILPEIKFSRKGLYEKCREYPELARAIEFTAKYHITHKLLMGETNDPDLSFLISMPLSERLKYIYEYSFSYRGFDKDDVSVENEESLMTGKLNPNSKYLDKTNMYLDALTCILLSKDADGCGPYMPIGGYEEYVTPEKIGKTFQNIDGFLVKK